MAILTMFRRRRRVHATSAATVASSTISDSEEVFKKLPPNDVHFFAARMATSGAASCMEMLLALGLPLVLLYVQIFVSQKLVIATGGNFNIDSCTVVGCSANRGGGCYFGGIF